MAAMKTPGVYIVEKSAFPNSVVEVATAVPAFIGYTEKAENGTTSILNTPWRITSMAEFHNFFGGAPTPEFTIKKTPPTDTDGETLTIKASAADTYYATLPKNFYTLYYNILLFYANGGGPCYIVSVGDYKTNPSSDTIIKGITPLIKEQEPTMLVIPEAVNFPEAECIKIQQAMLMHCGDKMKNRFAILDVWKGINLEEQGKAVKDFREDIGSNFLSYCASYFPWIETSILTEQDISYKNLKWNLYEESLSSSCTWPENIKTLVKEYEKKKKEALFPGLYLTSGKALIEKTYPIIEKTGKRAWETEIETLFTKERPKKTKAKDDDPDVLIPIDELTRQQKEELKAALKQFDQSIFLTAFQDAVSSLSAGAIPTMPDIYTNVVKEIKEQGWTNKQKEGIKAVLPDLFNNMVEIKIAVLMEEITAPKELPDMAKVLNDIAINTDKVCLELHSILAQNWGIYKNILAAIKQRLNLLPPSAAMAGIYTMVDNSRGVWKAPANVSINNVVKPSCNITHDEQEDLNVPLTGKAVNAIRFFTGEGVKIWGARTMDGNSLDWRYINVRRTMIFLEESIKNAARAYVFEPNVAGTWINMKGMIENFLRGIWKRGGLAGATPEDAFSVHVGLGDTMTPEDILEGILRITVLVAISHPAEFIEITFQQQMQKS